MFLKSSLTSIFLWPWRMFALGVVLLAAIGIQPSRAAEKYAIVIGVNECPKFRLPGGAKPRPLSGAETDARSFAELLQQQFGFAADKTQLLLGPAATSNGVLRALDKVAKSAGPDDQVVFYFSGHGTQIVDTRPRDEKDERDEALCLYDADATGRHLLVDDAIGRWLDRLEARRTTILLDCCHAGTGTKDVDDDVVPRFLPNIGIAADAKESNLSAANAWLELQGGQKSLDRRRAAFFACQPEQQAYERRMRDFKPGQRRGQFSYYLIEGLSHGGADKDGNGSVTGQELVDYINAQIDESFNNQRSRPADRQQPAIEADRLDESPF